MIPTSLLPRPRTILVGLVLLLEGPLAAQKPPVRTFPVDTAVRTTHRVTIRGAAVPYEAEVGMQPVWNAGDTVIASLFYTYYRRTDVPDVSRRPLVFSFNGGPGSASVWMHLGYTGPVKLRIDAEGYPIQPFGVDPNPHSILDVADIVFVNPVNVAFSRIVGGAKRDLFFGVNEDIGYLSDWIQTFVSRHDRWTSPKYLIGESYGTTRVSGLARELQGSEWMYLNGVILVSPTGLGIERDGPVDAALSLPNYTATAWYHKKLEPALQNRDLDEILPEVEAWVLDEYLPALARGGALPEARRQAIAQAVARWSGTSTGWVLNHNLAPTVGEFRKELLRAEGLTVGRLDARYRGRDREDGTPGDTHGLSPSKKRHGRSMARVMPIRAEVSIRGACPSRFSKYSGGPHSDFR